MARIKNEGKGNFSPGGKNTQGLEKEEKNNETRTDRGIVGVKGALKQCILKTWGILTF